MRRGSFWSGVRQGLISSALNHAMHMGGDGGGGDEPPSEVSRSYDKFGGLRIDYDDGSYKTIAPTGGVFAVDAQGNYSITPGSGASLTTDGPIEWILSPSKTISIGQNISSLGIKQGYSLVKTLGGKYEVYSKILKASNLPGQARAVYTKVYNITTKSMVRMYKDAFKIDGRHHERAHYKPHNYRSSIK